MSMYAICMTVCYVCLCGIKGILTQSNEGTFLLQLIYNHPSSLQQWHSTSQHLPGQIFSLYLSMLSTPIFCVCVCVNLPVYGGRMIPAILSHNPHLWPAACQAESDTIFSEVSVWDPHGCLSISIYFCSSSILPSPLSLAIYRCLIGNSLSSFQSHVSHHYQCLLFPFAISTLLPSICCRFISSFPHFAIFNHLLVDIAPRPEWKTKERGKKMWCNRNGK